MDTSRSFYFCLRSGAAIGILSMTILGATPVRAQPQQSKSPDLTEKSIEELMNMEVTSVSKKGEKFSHTAAAVFVITQEDIQHSGATNIPDMLRMVPGIYVAQIDANTWAITSRGFNSRFSNKLLVLVDGRTVYTPTTGGVFWDTLDMPLEDIERIEVIRGPGGAVWGANAVNGVINIITKKAADTRGAIIVAAGGNVEPAFGTFQYGGALRGTTDYRAFAKYLDYSKQPSPQGQSAPDDWHTLRGGFRVDHNFLTKDSLTLQGDMYTGREGVSTNFGSSRFAPNLANAYNVALSGGFLQGVWKHAFSDRSDTSLQVSYDTYQREDALDEGRKTLGINFQHHILLGGRHDVVWGLEDRYSQSRTRGNFFVSLNPANINQNLFGFFVQDEIALLSERLYLTLGTKIEHNYYTGWKAMPSSRLAWMPTSRQTLWGAVSRALHTPDDTDTSIRVDLQTLPNPGGPILLLALLGNRQSEDEGLIAYEIGYRSQISTRVSADLTMYYNDYTTQQTTEPGAPFFETSPGPPHLVLPLVYQNMMHGETHGLEIAGHWKVMDRWTVSSGYAIEKIAMHLSPSSQDTTSVGEAEGSTPKNSAQLRSQLALPRNLNWNTSAYFSGLLRDPVEPSYTRLDTSLSWQFGERSSIGLVGQNLLKDRHTEFVDSTESVQTTFIKRSVYARFIVRF